MDRGQPTFSSPATEATTTLTSRFFEKQGALDSCAAPRPVQAPALGGAIEVAVKGHAADVRQRDEHLDERRAVAQEVLASEPELVLMSGRPDVCVVVGGARNRSRLCRGQHTHGPYWSCRARGERWARTSRPIRQSRLVAKLASVANSNQRLCPIRTPRLVTRPMAATTTVVRAVRRLTELASRVVGGSALPKTMAMMK